MTQANLKWTFSINSTERLGVNPKSNLITYAVSGVATSPDGEDSHFIATNNLDPRYPERFKVNWNGSKARMPLATGHGIGGQLGGLQSIIACCFRANIDHVNSRSLDMPIEPIVDRGVHTPRSIGQIAEDVKLTTGLLADRQEI